MKNKILLSGLVMFLCLTAANAESYRVHVAAVDEFNTANPSQKIKVRVIEEAAVGNYNLQPDDVLHCDVIKVTDPKRGKRSASFAVCPEYFETGENTVQIKEGFYGKYAEKVISKEELKNVDPLKVGKKAAISVGNHFVKGIAPAVSMAEGMIENKNGNRIQSGVQQVYKDSPLSYVEKGQELKIEPGKSFYLVFKPSKSKKAVDIAEEIFGEE